MAIMALSFIVMMVMMMHLTDSRYASQVLYCYWRPTPCYESANWSIFGKHRSNAIKEQHSSSPSYVERVRLGALASYFCHKPFILLVVPHIYPLYIFRVLEREETFFKKK